MSLLTNKSIQEESKYPTLDVLTIIRKRRADWLRISFTNDPDMNQSRYLYIIKTWIENQETYSQILNINYTTRWWNFWKEKIGKKSCFKSYTNIIIYIIWTNSMHLYSYVFLNKMAFKNMTCKLTYVMFWTSLNYTPKRTTRHWWRIQALIFKFKHWRSTQAWQEAYGSIQVDNLVKI